MKTRRRHLGSSYSTYPARIIGDWVGKKVFSCFAAVLFNLIWMLVLFIILISGKAMAGGYAASRQEMKCYDVVGGLSVAIGIYIVGAVFVTIYVFRNVGNRKS